MNCNIGPPIGKFWMLPIITSARENAKPTEYDNNNKKIDVSFDCIEVSANSRNIYICTLWPKHARYYVSNQF